MNRREQIAMLRSISLRVYPTEAIRLRELAKELETEIKTHNDTAKRSYHKRKELDNDATGTP